MARGLSIALPPIAVALDALTTLEGLSRGIPEGGPLASLGLRLLGPAWFAVEYAVVHALALALARRLGPLGAVAASTGPWLAGWSNLFLLLLS